VSLTDELQDVDTAGVAFFEKVAALEGKLAEQREQLAGLARDTAREARFSIDPEAFKFFLQEPFHVDPVLGANGTEYHVWVPKAVNGWAWGWPVRETAQWRCFWLTKDTGGPDFLALAFPKTPDLKVEGNRVVSATIAIPEIASRFRGDVVDSEGRILDAWEVRRQLARMGIRQPTIRPVDPAELLPDDGSIVLRSYQNPAWDHFCQYGHVGVFAPPRWGKAYLALYAAKRTPGHVLMLIKSTNAREYLEALIEQYHVPDMKVATYAKLCQDPGSLRQPNGQEHWALVIPDECHIMPAEKCRQVADIKTRRLLCLSASPYREDGLQSDIMAMSGTPWFADWAAYLEANPEKRPKVRIFICRNTRHKTSQLVRLLQEPVTTLVYVEMIADGLSLEAELRAAGRDIPFVHGETENGGEVLTSNPVVIATRTADESLELPFQRIVQWDSLGCSRAQEVQRVGRIMSKGGEAVVLTTPREFERKRRRFLADVENHCDVSIEDLSGE